MKKTIIFLSLLLAVFSTDAFAQFEGKISYDLYELKNNGERVEEENFTAFITPQRILLQGDQTFTIHDTFKTEGLLIRLDKKDFVFITGDKSALSISKTGITSFMNMFGSNGQQQSRAESVQKSFTFKKAGETKTINGYDAQKFVFKDKDDKNKKGVVWMTQEININWGMLAEPWGDSVAFFMSEDFPVELVLQKGWLPVKATFYEDGKAEAGMSATIKETGVADKMVQLSSDMKVNSLSEYLFQMMRQKQ